MLTRQTTQWSSSSASSSHDLQDDPTTTADATITTGEPSLLQQGNHPYLRRNPRPTPECEEEECKAVILKPALLTKKVLSTEKDVKSLKTGLLKLRAEVFAAQDEDRTHFQSLYSELDAQLVKLNGAAANESLLPPLDKSSTYLKYLLCALMVPVLACLIFNVINSS